MRLSDIFKSKIFISSLFCLFLFNYMVFIAFTNKQKIIVEEKKDILDISIKSLMTDPLWMVDLENLKTITHDFANREEILSIKIYDIKSNLLASYETSLDNSTLKSQVPINKFGKPIGYIDIIYNYDFMAKNTKNLLFNIFQIEFLILLLILSLFLFYFKIVNQAIEKITESVLQLSSGNTDTNLNLKFYNLKPIEDNFNKLVTKLRNEKNLQKRNIEDFIHTKDELEAAYNQMISINVVLETTLSSLELSESKYKNIFKHSPFGIALFNIATSRIEDFNEELLRIFDNPPEKNLDSIFKNDGIFSAAKSIYDPKFTKDEEFYLASANKIVIMSVIPFKNDKKYMQIFFKDITELKTLQTKLQDYAKDLESEVTMQTKHLKEANAKIKNQQQKLVEDAYNKGLIEVTSGIIHNMGNIVNVISLSLDELVTSKESNENILPKFLDTVIIKELNEIPNLATASPQLEKALGILPRLLEYHREFEAELKNKIEFLIRKVYHLKEIVQLQQNFVGSLGTEDYNDINLIIDEVVEIYDSSLIKRNVRVEKDYKGRPQILCDKAQIIQLISNFIKNSYEAIEEKNIKEGLIKISSRVENQNFILEIYDNGLGIREPHLKELFDFGYSTKKELGSGSGFGLHSCKNIVEKYGGSINIESTYGIFTKFIITIPLKKEN